MASTKQLWSKRPPVIVGISGGSGSGKTWLANHLVEQFDKEAVSFSLDDFYRDRSHLSTAVRSRINFDHPRSIDWDAFESCLADLAAGKPVTLPSYDFTSHCRNSSGRLIPFRQVVIVEGLWLFRRPSVRRHFHHRIYVDCPTALRLERRLERDCRERGRTATCATKQFQTFVEPMHQRFVAPQQRWAHTVYISTLTTRDVQELAQNIRLALAK